MKLTAIFLLAVCLNASANGFAQKVSLSEKNVSLEKVFREIKKQTGYTFAYTKALLQKAKPVTISISNAPIETVLDLCFQGQPLDYTIINKTVVVVNKKEVAPEKEQVSIPTPVPIQGKITNNKGEPLRGATVTEKGTQNLTMTNEEGNFSINVTSSKSILVISYVGFESKEVVVANQTSFDIALASTQQQISEVVIVGYGTQKRKSLTGSVASVSASAYKDQPVTNISSALQGRASGVSVSNTSGAPGGEVKIRIRGSNSITASNDPLYVVDGVALGSVGLQDINVNDIESMDILKDASATAIYGSRGANGVVIITTKSGKSGASKVEYNTFVSFNRPMKKYELLDAVAYAKLANHIAGTNVYADPESFAGKSTDWQDLIFKDGITQNHQLSLSGGTEKSRYYLSGNYVDQTGLVVNTNQKKYALRSNIDTRISNKFTAGLNFYVSHINSHNTADIGGKGNPLMSALAWGPTEPIYDDAATGQYNKSTSSPIWGNPYMTAMERVGDVRSNAAVANAKVKYTINDWLTFDFNVGADYSIAKSAYYNNEWINTNKGSGQSSTESFTIQNSNVLTAHKVFGNIHDVTAMAIVEETSNKTNYFTASGSGLSTSLGSYYDLQNNSAQGISSGYSNWSLLSYVGRISYALMDKYLLTATYRTDGSSKFQKSNNKWGRFPSIGVGWRLSEEKFIKDLDLFSSLKLRAGYGVTGNQAIAPYKTLGTLQSAGYSFGTTTVSSGYVIGNPPNPDLTWETTKQTDIGFDAGFLNNRINISADYFVKKTESLLLDVPVPAYDGGGTITKNVGKVENKGFEMSLEVTPIRTKNFSWTATLNGTSYRNKVVSLGSDSILYRNNIGHGLINTSIQVVKTGEALGSFYLIPWAGINQSDNHTLGYKAGDNNYIDVSGNNAIGYEDRVISGSALPKFQWGFNNSFRYGNFDLNVFLQGSHGNKIFNATYAATAAPTSDVKFPTLAESANYWTSSKKDAVWANPASKTNRNYVESTQFLQDGSYVRLKNISLSYTLRKSLIKFAAVRLSASGQNLFTITDYKGFDPEASSTGSATTGISDADAGIDLGAYPSPRTLTLGVNLIF